MGKALLLVQAVCGRWRRLELGCWPSVLMSVQKRFELRARGLALLYYRTSGVLGAEPPMDDSIKSLSKTDEVLRDCVGISSSAAWLFKGRRSDIGFVSVAA